MSITRQMARVLLEEHKYRPIQGDVVFCGRQTTPFSVEEARGFLTGLGVALRPGAEPVLDELTRGAKGKSLIRDDSFLQLFADVRYNAVDLSDYEGANLIHNMCAPVGGELRSRFDFLFNGSCMDNLASPGQFLVNTSTMLRPGGVAVHIEHGSLWQGAYLMYSPDFFFDFYAVNRYADCKVYFAVFDGDPARAKWGLYHWDPLAIQGTSIGYLQSNIDTKSSVLIITIAEKGSASTDDRLPVQVHYRSREDVRIYYESALGFRKSKRPVLDLGGGRSMQPGTNIRFCGDLS